MMQEENAKVQNENPISPLVVTATDPTPLVRLANLIGEALRELGAVQETTPAPVAEAHKKLVAAVESITESELQAEKFNTYVEHIYHHADPNDVPKVSAKAEKNTKGWNLEASVSNCRSVEQAIDLLKKTTDSLQRTYAQPAPAE